MLFVNHTNLVTVGRVVMALGHEGVKVVEAER